MVHSKQVESISALNSDKVHYWSRPALILLLIIIVSALLRLVNLGQSPPGLNQDEATNAWNAYCLLETGKDQAGISWPIFYTRGLGHNRSTLYIYTLIPFQAVGGMNVSTTRLPAAIGGIFTVLLIYFVGKRLFDWKTALLAAGLLALNPWHIQQSRWGHDASLSSLLGLAPLAMILWAGMPLGKDETLTPRVLPAVLAGIVTGIVCYGYHSVRLFVPVFLLAIVLVSFTEWRNVLKSHKGILAIAAFILAFSLTFGPLSWQHIFHSENIALHAQDQERIFTDSDSFLVILKNLSLQYANHFGLDFLFLRGDHFAIQSPPRCGQFHWYMLPLMVIGLITLLSKFKSSLPARILLVFVIVYPIGDCFFKTSGSHAMRSLPGLCGLILLGSVGGIAFMEFMWKRNLRMAVSVIVVFVISVIVLNIRYLNYFYRQYNRQPEIYHAFQTDFVKACEWLRPRIEDVDAVFCTTKGLNMPYVVSLVALEYEPEKWFSQPRDFFTTMGYNHYTNYGKMYFMYKPALKHSLQKLQQNTRRERVLFMIRPNQLNLGKPLYKIDAPDGRTCLWICEVFL